jgi:carbon storage regulator CsrA
MLILSRRQNEQIVLPGLGITIVIVAIKPGVVRIGIKAPPDIAILRTELLDERHRSGLPRMEKIIVHPAHDPVVSHELEVREG